MKDKEICEAILGELISMLPEEIPDYTKFKFNPTKNIIRENFKNVSESLYNKNLSDIVNFPIKTEEEFYVFTFCIMNLKYLKSPARTRKCRHIECMEASFLFKFIIEKGKCPLCYELDQESNFVLGVDSIYIDKNFRKIFKNSLNDSPNDFGFPIDMIIFNKFTLKWRPYLPDNTYMETEILIDSNFNEEKNIENFNEKDRNYLELVEMNKYIGVEGEFEEVLSKLIN